MSNERRIVFLLNQAQHQLNLYIDKILRKTADITGAQAAALIYLNKHNGCVQKQLAQGLKLDNSAVTGMVDRLQRKGLIERHRCKLDGRAFTLHLTPLARESLEQVWPIINTHNKQLADKFGEESIESFCNILQYLVDFTSSELNPDGTSSTN